jgi:beta-galactosidase
MPMNRLLLFFLLLGGFGYTQKYQPQFSTAGFYQTDKSVREAISFNVGWRFIKQDVTGAEKHDFDDSAWSVVNLPDGLELLPLAASGGVNYQGPAWYRKQFSLNETMRSKKVILHFEGIMGKSKIWVNGAMVKENFSGYYPIHIDVTEYVDFKKPNTVAVRADNSNDKTYPPGKPQEQLDFTYFGGIYRDAWLITHNHTYVTHPTAAEKVAGGGVFVHYENLSEKSVDVFVDVDVKNEGKKKTVFVQLDLLDSDGNAVASSVNEYQLPKKNAVQTHAQFTVPNPKLWRP